MSFTLDVKEELVKTLPNETHCRLAELAALLKLYAKITTEPELAVTLSEDNPGALKKCFTLLTKTFNIRADIFQREDDDKKYAVVLNKQNCNIEEIFGKLKFDDPLSLLKRDCCKRAYLRGAFLASGFVNDPSKGYHFEILTETQEDTKLLTYLLSEFNIIPRHSVRKKYNVIYIKESEAVSDVLSVLGAKRSMMELTNAKIVRNVRNNVNRRNNCDMANIAKSADAAARQMEDIRFIYDTVGLNALPDSLKEIAEKRMEYPESSYTELGTLLDPPVGKSGVNHRLRKLSEFAADLRSSERNKT